MRNAFVAAVALAPIVVVGACRERAGLVDRGGECFLATDCALGLVCVDQGEGIRTCTDDLSEVAGEPPPDGAMPPEAGGDAPRDAPRNDANPPIDSGQDTGQPPVDAGEDG
jgi:hypothetical protein